MTINAMVVDPDEALYEGEITVCNARSVEGEIGILPGHQPCLLLLAPSPLELIDTAGVRHTFMVVSGFLEYSGETLTVLCDEAEEVENKAAAFAELERRGLTIRDAESALDSILEDVQEFSEAHLT